MAESTFHFPIWILALGGLIVAGGLFVFVYWMMGRGKDDDSA